MLDPAVSLRWQSAPWRGEPAWQSVRGSVRAVVSETRARLLYLGSLDGHLNLINAPYPHVSPAAGNPWPNQGGHRFWLGPQSRWVWPPPQEWEYTPALQVSSEGDRLYVHHAQIDSTYPALLREYAWEADRLRCTIRWADNGQAFFGMHVLAVDLPFETDAALDPTSEAPQGVVQVELSGARRDGFLPHPGIALGPERATIRGGRQTIKLGFPVQPLQVARRQGWHLALCPGPHEGVADSAPDFGYLSQIWVGGPEYDLAELEQLTPFLRGGAAGHCSSTVFFVATPPRN